MPTDMKEVIDPSHLDVSLGKGNSLDTRIVRSLDIDSQFSSQNQNIVKQKSVEKVCFYL